MNTWLLNHSIVPQSVEDNRNRTDRWTFVCAQQHVDLVPTPAVNWDHLHCLCE